MNMREGTRIAGVLVATVSRALRAPGKVSSAVLQRVQKVNWELGDVHNASAGDVLKGRSTVLAPLVPSASMALLGETLHGIQDVATRSGYSVIQGTTHYDGAKEGALSDKMLQRRVFSLILTGMTYPVEERVELLARQERARVVVVREKPNTDVHEGQEAIGLDDAHRRPPDRCLRGLRPAGHRRAEGRAKPWPVRAERRFGCELRRHGCRRLP